VRAWVRGGVGWVGGGGWVGVDRSLACHRKAEAKRSGGGGRALGACWSVTPEKGREWQRSGGKARAKRMFEVLSARRLARIKNWWQELFGYVSGFLHPSIHLVSKVWTSEHNTECPDKTMRYNKRLINSTR